MAKIDVETLGTPSYRRHYAPGWGRGIRTIHQEMFIKFFLGRAGEDIRVYDAVTENFVKVEGPAVDVPLTKMTKQEYNALKQTANGLSGLCYCYKIKDKEKTKGPDKDNLFAGALWLPA
jgi:hypothetical protein